VPLCCLKSIKNPNDPIGLEPAKFRLVGQYVIIHIAINFVDTAMQVRTKRSEFHEDALCLTVELL
jgi:hypothetical protein